MKKILFPSIKMKIFKRNKKVKIFIDKRINKNELNQLIREAYIKYKNETI